MEKSSALTAQITFVTSTIKLTLLLKTSALSDRILAFSMLTPPASENAWIHIHYTGLTKLQQQREYEEKEGTATEGEECVSEEISIKKLEQMFRNFETAKQQITDLDTNEERSMLLRRNLENEISCYIKFYGEEKTATTVQTTLKKYLCRK